MNHAKDHTFVADAEYADRCGICFEPRKRHPSNDLDPIPASPTDARTTAP